MAALPLLKEAATAALPKPQPRTCEYCKKVAQGMQWCGRCHDAWYCKREHQSLAWSQHRTKCEDWKVRQAREYARWSGPALVAVFGFCATIDYAALGLVSKRFHRYSQLPASSPYAIVTMRHDEAYSALATAGEWDEAHPAVMGANVRHTVFTKLAPRVFSASLPVLHLASFHAAVCHNPKFRLLESVSLLRCGAWTHMHYIPLLWELAKLPRLHTLRVPRFDGDSFGCDGTSEAPFPALTTLHLEQLSERRSRPFQFPPTLTDLSIQQTLIKVDPDGSGLQLFLLRLTSLTALKFLTVNPVGHDHHADLMWQGIDGEDLGWHVGVATLLSACPKLESLRSSIRFFGTERKKEQKKQKEDEDPVALENANTYRTLVAHPALCHLDVICSCTAEGSAFLIKAADAMPHLTSLKVICVKREPCTRFLLLAPRLRARLQRYEAECLPNIMQTADPLSISSRYEMPELTSLAVPAFLLSPDDMKTFAPKLHTLCLKGPSYASDVFYKNLGRRLKHLQHADRGLPHNGRTTSAFLPVACSQLETFDDFRVDIEHGVSDYAACAEIHKFKQLRSLTAYIWLCSHMSTPGVWSHAIVPRTVPESQLDDIKRRCHCRSTIENHMAVGWMSRENLPHLHTLRILPAVLTARSMLPGDWIEWVQGWRQKYFRHITHFNDASMDF
jgi:hypothetical protein